MQQVNNWRILLRERYWNIFTASWNDWYNNLFYLSLLNCWWLRICNPRSKYLNDTMVLKLLKYLGYCRKKLVQQIFSFSLHRLVIVTIMHSNQWIIDGYFCVKGTETFSLPHGLTGPTIIFLCHWLISHGYVYVIPGVNI